jgi:pimeloyl-ACP methyl ester carboxylesterase
LLKRFYQRRERYYAALNDNRIVRPFEWGEEFADARFLSGTNGASPESFFREYSRQAIARSAEFFALAPVSSFDFQLSSNGEDAFWQSQIKTLSPENNTVRARLFKTAKPDEKKRAVIVLPHWNAPADAYVALCKVFRRVGIAALRLTLPYHEKRQPAELDRADYLVCSNIGRTLESIRQAVLDTRAAVAFLKSEGYERIGIVGTSIGSCTGFLAMAHEPEIAAGVFNHVSGYFADVVWRGISTRHVKAALEKHLTLETLRELWMPASPLAFLDKIKTSPPRPMRYIYTLYDLTFPLDLSRATVAAFRQHRIEHDETVLPCGHYTLGEAPWVYLDGYKIVSYLRKHL